MIDSANKDSPDRIEPDESCPRCGEDDPDMLEWLDDERVRCTGCGHTYTPGTATTGGTDDLL